MSDQIARWDRRHAAGDETYGGEPSPVLVAAARQHLPARAIDLACGSGRHALFLARHGWRVTAVDGSHVAVETLQAAASRSGISDLIHTQVCDLEAEPPRCSIAPERFELVADFFYLHRALFPVIRDALRPGGLFAAAIHIDGAGAAPHRYRLRAGELQRLIDEWGWATLHSRETSVDASDAPPTAEIIARRPW